MRTGVYVTPSFWNQDDYFAPDALTAFGTCCLLSCCCGCGFGCAVGPMPPTWTFTSSKWCLPSGLPTLPWSCRHAAAIAAIAVCAATSAIIDVAASAAVEMLSSLLRLSLLLQ